MQFRLKLQHLGATYLHRRYYRRYLAGNLAMFTPKARHLSLEKIFKELIGRVYQKTDNCRLDPAGGIVRSNYFSFEPLSFSDFALILVFAFFRYERYKAKVYETDAASINVDHEL